jgi:tetratricopeptide (TPR) repeat protein
LNPKDTYVYKSRGNEYLRLGKYNEAIIDCNKAIELNPEYAILYYIRASLYSLIGNSKRAPSVLAEYLWKSSNDGVNHLFRGT